MNAKIIFSDAPYWNKRSLKISNHLVVICVFYRPEGIQMFLPFLWYKITKSRIFSQCNTIETWKCTCTCWVIMYTSMPSFKLIALWMYNLQTRIMWIFNRFLNKKSVSNGVFWEINEVEISNVVCTCCVKTYTILPSFTTITLFYRP